MPGKKITAFPNASDTISDADRFLGVQNGKTVLFSAAQLRAQLKGKDGIDGKDGKDGVDGKPGLDGAPGKDGVNGKDGTDGLPGKDGAPGADGAPGKNGIDGTNGKNGVDGTNGKDGTNGTNGSNGAKGTAKYSQRLATSTDGTIPITFPAGMFAAGVVPVVNGVVEMPADQAAYAYKVDLVGTPTNTSAKLRVTRMPLSLTISLGALTLQAAVGAGVYVHVTANDPAT